MSLALPILIAGSSSTSVLPLTTSLYCGPEAELAFIKLKSHFTYAPTLILPKPDKPFIVEVDVSYVGVGAVLSQRGEDNKLHPCALFSHHLTQTGTSCALEFLQRQFWWPAIKEDVTTFINMSHMQLSEVSYHSPQGLLHPFSITHRTWSHLSIDFITGLPLSHRNTTIMVTAGRFFKAAWFIPLLKLPTTKETAELVINHVFRVFGIPQDIVSDQGPQFSP